VKVKKSEVLKALKADWKSADILRKELDGKISIWRREYNGEKYGNEKEDRSQIVSRDIKKQSEWQHASIIDPFVSNPDIIKANPVTWEDRPAARQAEVVLNTFFCRKFPRYNFMTKAAKVLDQEGTCVIMTGWDYEDEEVDVEVPQYQINPFTGQAEVIGTEMVKELKVIKNQPTAKVCRNEDVWIDPTCQDDMENCQFVIYRYETDISTLKQDGRYKNLDKISLNAEDNDYDSEDTTEFKFGDDARKKVVVYEYWGNYDINGDGIVEPIVCAWVEDVIIRLQDNPYPDKRPPFIVVPFNSVPFQMYGEPNAELLSDTQKVKTAIFRGFIDNMAQSNNAQKGIPKGFLDATNKKRFFNGEHYEYNPLNGQLIEGTYNQLPSSAFDILQLMNNDAESITGVKSFSQGITGNSLGSTATGARGALDATATRRLNIVRNIAENLIKPLMRKWLAYSAEFLSETEIVRITNEEFVEIKRDDLKGLVDIDIAVSTNEDNSAKAQELAFMLQTMGPSEDPGIRKIIMSEIARLHRMPDLAKKLEEFQPQPDPMQQQAAMLQLELLKAQVQNEYAKGAENRVDVELKSAKTQNELAKAGKLASEKDVLDQDFLQKESGQDADLLKKQFELDMMQRKNYMDLEKTQTKNQLDMQGQASKLQMERARGEQKLALEREKAKMKSTNK